MSAQETVAREALPRVQVDYDYIKHTWFGRLRMAELLGSLLCGICISSVYTIYHDCHLSPAAFGFHRFVAWVTFLNLLVYAFIRILGFHTKLLECYRRVEIHLMLCVIATVSFFISSSIVASVTYCPISTAQSAGAGFSVFFGYLCMVLFGIESYLHFLEYRSPPARSMDEAHDDQPEPIPDSDIVSPGIV